MNNMRKLMEAMDSFNKNNVIAQAGEFKVVRDDDGMVHLIDGEQNIRVSMFRHEWDDLIASYDNGDYIGEAEDMLAVDPALQAELDQDKQDNVWSVWYGDSEGGSGFLKQGLTKEKAEAFLKMHMQELMNDWSEEAYVVHTAGSNMWKIKDPKYQVYAIFELHKYDDGMRDWSV